MVNNAININKK